MCSPATCSRCGKTTWSGCGMHADAVMNRVPPTQRCVCHSATSSTPTAGVSLRRRP